QSPAPATLLQSFQPLFSKVAALQKLSPAERIVATPQGLAAVALTEISRSDRSNGTGVVMLFARFIRDAEVARVRDTGHMPAGVIPIVDVTPAFAALPAPVKAWAMAGKRGASTFVFSPNDQQTTGYALVNTVDGRPAAIFSTS